MNQEQPNNPFAASTSRRAKTDTAIRIGFCAITYFIVVLAIAVFADITIKGAPVVFPKIFGQDGPFVNTDLFTKDPETLVVFEDVEADKITMGFGEFSNSQAKPLRVGLKNPLFGWVEGGS